MPHDVKGRAIEVGDTIVARPFNHRSPNTFYAGTVNEIGSSERVHSGQFRYLSETGKVICDWFGAGEATVVIKKGGQPPKDEQCGE